MRIALMAVAVLFVGCAAHSSVAPMGRDTFLLSKQAATGFAGLGNMKAEVLSEANAHCARSGKSMEVVNTSESKGPYILGNYPRVEVQFSCR